MRAAAGRTTRSTGAISEIGWNAKEEHDASEEELGFVDGGLRKRKQFIWQADLSPEIEYNKYGG